MPDSMIVVHTSTSNWPSQKSTTTCSSVPSSICPWATAMRASGTSSRRRAAACSIERDPVVDPEHLALAEQLAADRLDGDALVVLADVGEDRLAVGRRRLQQRQVADADEAHLQRARDRRGRQREHVDVRLELLHRLLVLHAEALLLVDDEQAEVLELDLARRAGGGCRSRSRPRRTRCPSIDLAWPAPAVRKRLTASRRGSGSRRSGRRTCCRAGWPAASSGASTATCLPSWIALNAARIATSVLPKPTSPHSRRSIGYGRSMSALTSSMALRWSGVSTYGKASSISCCHGVSWPNAWPSALTRFWYSTTSSWAISRTAERTRLLALAKSLPPRRCSVGASPPTYWRSDVDLVATARTACRRPCRRRAGSRARRRRSCA